MPEAKRILRQVLRRDQRPELDAFARHDEWNYRRPVREGAKDFLRKIGKGVTPENVYEALLGIGREKVESADRMSGDPNRFLRYTVNYWDLFGYYDRKMNWLRVQDCLSHSRNAKVPLVPESLGRLRRMTDHLRAGRSRQALEIVSDMAMIAGEP